MEKHIFVLLMFMSAVLGWFIGDFVAFLGQENISRRIICEDALDSIHKNWELRFYLNNCVKLNY